MSDRTRIENQVTCKYCYYLSFMFLQVDKFVCFERLLYHRRLQTFFKVVVVDNVRARDGELVAFERRASLQTVQGGSLLPLLPNVISRREISCKRRYADTLAAPTICAKFHFILVSFSCRIYSFCGCFVTTHALQVGSTRHSVQHELR